MILQNKPVRTFGEWRGRKNFKEGTMKGRWYFQKKRENSKKLRNQDFVEKMEGGLN